MNIYQINFPLVLQVVCLSFKLGSSTRALINTQKNKLITFSFIKLTP